MIIWLSGAYGVGKSTVARALATTLPNALIFDAEEVGNAVRENYPNYPFGYIYEDYPLWGEFCPMLLKDIHETFHKNILVPMTLLRHYSYGIIEKLNTASIPTELLILEGSRQTIHDRIISRGEDEDCWCMENMDLARAGCSALPGIHIQTDGRTPEEIVAEIHSILNLT